MIEAAAGVGDKTKVSLSSHVVHTPAVRLPFLQSLKVRVCCSALRLIARQCPELMVDFIGERASEIAVGVTMTMLDRERIIHCQQCPQRFALRKTSAGVYTCNKHFNALK